MTKEEIYEAIGYKGKYNKEVKRKLRLLMKKFHPDVNHNDDRVMKLLVEVKNELIHHKVSYRKIEPKKKEEKQKVYEQEEVIEDDFSKISVKALTDKVNDLLKEMEKVQESLFLLYKNLTKEESKYLTIEKEYKNNAVAIKEIKEDLSILKKVSKAEVLFLSLSFINFFVLFIKFHIGFICSLLIFVFAYVFCLLLKNIKKSKLTDKVYDLEIDALIITKELRIQEEVVSGLKKQEGIFKRKVQKIKDDISFYNHVIAKKTNKTRNYEYDHKNVYTKRK